MDDLGILRMFNLVVGAIGIVIGIAVVFAPKTIRHLNKELDKTISTTFLGLIARKSSLYFSISPLSVNPRLERLSTVILETLSLDLSILR